MSRIIRVLPTQVPLAWEAIKFALVKSSVLEQQTLPATSLYVLHDLLNGKMQCFLTLSEERLLLQILLTRVNVDKLTTRRECRIIALYSFQKIKEEDTRPSFDLIRDIARAEQCERVVCQSGLPRMWELFEAMGMTEVSRQYVVQV